jgi:protein pelota
MEQSRIAREASLMESLLKEIAMDGKVVYGVEEVKRANNYGSIETLLISDEFLLHEREKGEGGGIDSFIRNVEYSQGKLVVFSTEFEPGQKLEALGGIAALLRFKV